MKQSPLWFSDYNKTYHGDEPLFYDVNQLDIARELEKNYPAIRDELKVLWDHSDPDSKPTFLNYDSFDDKQFPSGSWKKMVFKVWGIDNKRICEIFPFTSSLIKKFPRISSCFLTKTSPQSIIKTHCGETNAHLRIHLGLNVPDVDMSVCGMEVEGQTIGWQNGKTFAFLDAHSHHVWNKSNEDRYILIIDLIRPEYSDKMKFICARVIVSQLYFFLTSLMGFKFLFKIPALILDFFTYIAFVPVQIAIAINSKYPFVKL